MTSDKWVKYVSRGMKIQKGLDYAYSITDPFRNFFGEGIDSWLYVSRGESVDFYVQEKEWQKFIVFATEKFQKDEGWYDLVLDNFEKGYLPHLDWLKSLNVSEIANYSNDELVSLFEKYKQSLEGFMVVLWVVVALESVIEETVYELLKQANVESKDLESLAQVMTAPTTINYLFQEEIDLHAISRLPQEEQAEALKHHAHRYEYIRMYDYDYEPYELGYFSERLEKMSQNPEVAQEILEKKKALDDNRKRLEKLMSDLSLNSFNQKRVRALSFLSNHKDQRSHFRSQESYYGRNIFGVIAAKLGISVSDCLYLLHTELTDALYGKISSEELRAPVDARRKGYVLLVNPDTTEVLTGEDMKVYIAENLESDSKTVVKGLGVMAGTVKGVVRIILHTNDLRKLKSGDIMVAPMTRPDYVTAMKICSAIVTDEGGVLCHAAIVSRELGIPCIVGTKNATQFLKDGDMVEVDGGTGVVTVL